MDTCVGGYDAVEGEGRAWSFGSSGSKRCSKSGDRGTETASKQIGPQLHIERSEVWREMAAATLRNSIWVVSYISAINLLHSK